MLDIETENKYDDDIQWFEMNQTGTKRLNEKFA